MRNHSRRKITSWTFVDKIRPHALDALVILLTVTITVLGPGARMADASKVNAEDNQAIASVSPAVLGKSSNTTDGAAFIDKCLKAAEDYTDYTFDYKQTVYKEKTVVETGTLMVKKPQLKVLINSGSKAGSVAVLLPNGQVRAHGGGAFKFITVTLSADNDMLRSANGWPMVQSDFASVWRAMQGYAKHDKCPVKVTEEPVSEPTQKEKVLVLEMTKPSGEMYKRALIDPKTNLPVEWWDYQHGKVYAHSSWTNFKGNQGLSDKVFQTTKVEKGDK
jgi:outer membrane lipoprotein-sorting protein